jgi:phospholipase/lecithinase/hemolysin
MSLVALSDLSVSIIRNILIKNIDSWNEALGQQLVAWREKAGASANLFPVGQVFDDIMDQPEKYGFIQADTYTRGGGIWADHVHATEAVHKIVFEAFRAQME